ncbi:hypothetical protein PIB30_024230 [Stylosanthes scabra]|uniref:Uncharacterized protein n=1 Tax=Stylosanthes scabra TaxID=79078 RepID=A0ABU6S9P8_9FABA|nr:hypothetical protein [Stylosanthes scabra]
MGPTVGANCSGAEIEEFDRLRTSRMSSSKISVLGQRMNTSASTRIFSVALISKERRGVDLQGHSDAQLGLDAVRGLSDRIPNSSGFEDLADKSYKSSSDELFWAELMTGRNRNEPLTADTFTIVSQKLIITLAVALAIASATKRSTEKVPGVGNVVQKIANSVYASLVTLAVVWFQKQTFGDDPQY